MRVSIEKITNKVSKFFLFHQEIKKEAKINNWKIEIKELPQRTYTEETRRLDYQKIGSNIEVVETITVENKQKETITQSFEGVAFKKIEKDIDKMFF